MRILVAIPVFNELKYVEKVLDKVSQFTPDILCIDDGSTDGTAELLAGRGDIQLIRHPVNRGYGQSIIDAFQFADAHGYDWVITMDCDEQHEPERIPDLSAPSKPTNGTSSAVRAISRPARMTICRRAIAARSTRR